MSVAPARSPGCSRVMSDRLTSTVTAAPSAAWPRRIGGGDLEQVRVPVVHDPVLWPRQQRREPAAHRARAAAEVVDHAAAGCGEAWHELIDEVA